VKAENSIGITETDKIMPIVGGNNEALKYRSLFSSRSFILRQGTVDTF